MLVAASFFLLAGMTFALIYIDGFLPRYNYWTPWLWVFGLPAGIGTFYLIRRMGAADDIRTRWILWLAWPLFSLVCGAMWMGAVNGWLMASSRFLALNEISSREVLLVSNQPYEGRRSRCSNKAELKTFYTTKSACLDDFLAGGPITPGMRLQVTGHASPLGFHIVRIAPLQPGPMQ
ncbi:hypothetical protein IP84_04270 [beta proteobacterium AAP99]|nr:hypothetical protein IP84_04270 [beta proteobacterium AAP99]